ncbi:MAG: hypothetical protein QOE75_752, partial [Solirubrobacterales bacterium]|nr:hypothetical protein [Solirubrobacterales bacterium]
VGGRTPEQVDGWIGAATLELDAATVAAIAGARDEALMPPGSRRG